MSGPNNGVMVVLEATAGRLSDVSLELISLGKDVANSLGGPLVGVLIGASDVALTAVGCDIVDCYVDFGTIGYSSEMAVAALSARVEAIRPRLLLAPTGTLGLDLCSALSVAFDATLASYVVGLSVDAGRIQATSQLYGGKLLADCDLGDGFAIACVVPGSAVALQLGVGDVEVSNHSLDAIVGSLAIEPGIRHEPEASGVDIVAAELLVSVGRGIGASANLEVVQELADALGVPMSASRPVIDQGWLPKPHQVGKSGKKVKPKVYLSFGISGAPEHLEGMRQSEVIIACNTDPNAPIFKVAHYGTTLDLFDLVPELVELVEG